MPGAFALHDLAGAAAQRLYPELSPGVPGLVGAMACRAAGSAAEEPSTGSVLPPADCEQIARLLAGHARLIVDDLERRYALLPGGSAQRLLKNTLVPSRGV